MEPVTPAVVVRPAAVSDAAAVVAVQIETWRAAYTGIVPDGFLTAMSAAERVPRVVRALREADRRDVHAVAESDGHVVGFVRGGACRDDDLDPGVTGEVWALYVLPDWWDHGVGRALMQHALGHLCAARFTACTLWVLEDNARARRFYERAGLAPDGARKVLDLGAEVAEVRYRRGL